MPYILYVSRKDEKSQIITTRAIIKMVSYQMELFSFCLFNGDLGGIHMFSFQKIVKFIMNYLESFKINENESILSISH